MLKKHQLNVCETLIELVNTRKLNTHKDMFVRRLANAASVLLETSKTIDLPILEDVLLDLGVFMVLDTELTKNILEAVRELLDKHRVGLADKLIDQLEEDINK